MEDLNMPQSKPFRLPILVIGEWLMVLPATVFLAAAALRLLQPREYEPARTSWIVFQWTITHISRLGAAILLIGMPSVVVMVGCMTFLRTWREDQALRQDSIVALAILRRHLALGLMTVATLLAGAIVTLALVHGIRG
jgi:hypothetical protein